MEAKLRHSWYVQGRVADEISPAGVGSKCQGRQNEHSHYEPATQASARQEEPDKQPHHKRQSLEFAVRMNLSRTSVHDGQIK